MNSEILQLNFKKIKSNSINVIDFESTLDSRNKPFYDQSDQKSMFKRDSIKMKRENRIKNPIMNKYIDKESNNFNSIHFSQNENFSGKTKETNLTNPESNRQTNSIISSAKLSQQFEINKLLGKDIKNLNNYNDTNKHLKKWNNNSMTLEHFRPTHVDTNNIKHAVKWKNNKIDSGISYFLDKKTQENKKLQQFNSNLYNDIKFLFDFKKNQNKNCGFVPNLKYPFMVFENEDKNLKENLKLNRSLTTITTIIHKFEEKNFSIDFIQWKKQLNKTLIEKIKK